MKALYRTKEWQDLDLYLRADFITCIEGVRPGAQLDQYRNNQTLFQEKKIIIDDMLKDLGMVSYEAERKLYVTHDQSLLDKLLNQDIHMGQFLGYPECCIEPHYERSKAHMKGQGFGGAIMFWAKARQAILNETGKFNSDLLYTLWVPCSLQCKPSLELGTKIKETLESCDQVAADNLRQFERGMILSPDPEILAEMEAYLKSLEK